MALWCHRHCPSRMALIALLGILFLEGTSAILGQAPVSIDGHVFHAEGHSPCGDALIQAWPCGSTFTADLDGRFEASCPEGIDSVTVLAHGHAVVTVLVDGRDHLDIALESLAVSLQDAAVRVAVLSEQIDGHRFAIEIGQQVHRMPRAAQRKHQRASAAVNAQEECWPKGATVQLAH